MFPFSAKCLLTFFTPVKKPFSSLHLIIIFFFIFSAGCSAFWFAILSILSSTKRLIIYCFFIFVLILTFLLCVEILILLVFLLSIEAYSLFTSVSEVFLFLFAGRFKRLFSIEKFIDTLYKRRNLNVEGYKNLIGIKSCIRIQV